MERGGASAALSLELTSKVEMVPGEQLEVRGDQRLKSCGGVGGVGGEVYALLLMRNP